jgi:hypothetical protein
MIQLPSFDPSEVANPRRWLMVVWFSHNRYAIAMSPSTDRHDLARLEAAVIRLHLSDDTPLHNLLRAQWEASQVVERELTGVGFYTTFDVPLSFPKVLDPSRRTLGDVHAEIDGLPNGAGFILWIEDGRLSCLEGYCYQEQWPDQVNAFRVWKSSDSSELV